MKKAKYMVEVNATNGISIFESDSRNARKHLLERHANEVFVYLNDNSHVLVSHAVRISDVLLLFGAVKR